ncbi:MAG: YopX family protein [Ferruginibacter sp.]
MEQDNQRVIKFRAWDNGMFNDVIVDDDSWTDDIISDRWHCGNIMQYTGLKDKNGKEIYEGDIVNQEKWVKVGTYVKAIGIVKYIGVKFTCDCINDWEGSNADLNGNAEIIGNIYENSNLLKK